MELQFNMEEAIEQTPNVELKDGEEFRQFLMNDILKGYAPYQRELQNYFVQLIDNTTPEWIGTTAAVDAGLKMIYIAKQEKDRLTDSTLTQRQRDQARDNMSLLIRHELLHSILDHQRRTIIFIAKVKGWDPANLTQEQYEEVLRLRNSPDILFRRYNAGTGITSQNGAGDLELSKYYLERDVELQDAAGGLVLDDHPQWKNYSFEDLMLALKRERRELYIRLYRTHYGKMDLTTKDTGDSNAFKTRAVHASAFEDAVEIDPKDLGNVRLLHLEEYAALPADLKNKVEAEEVSSAYSWSSPVPGSWINGPFIEDNRACLCSNATRKVTGTEMQRERVKSNKGSIKIWTDKINQRHAVFAVIDVPNLDLYTSLDEGDNVICLGKTMRVLPYKRGILYPVSLGASIFDSITAKKYYSNSYRNSTIQGVLEEWYDELKAKNNIK